MELTDRQREVLLAMREGHTIKAIGANLGISPKTVEKHRQRLFTVFKVDNAMALVISALRQNIIPL